MATPGTVERLASLTIDVEPDYGGQLGETYRVLESDAKLAPLKALLLEEGVAPTQFLVGKLLDDHKAAAARAVSLGGEMELHSYSHPMGPHDMRDEVERGIAAYERYFGTRPLGYRSPLGRIDDRDYVSLARAGFRFSSSVFPALRPGMWAQRDHAAHSLLPVHRDEGLWELPMACVPGLRAIVSMSYLKFFGKTAYRALTSTMGLPSVVVLDSHLHDFITTDRLQELPLKKRFRYLHHKNDGVEVLRWLVRRLKGAGYRFVTMSQIVDRLDAGAATAVVR